MKSSSRTLLLIAVMAAMVGSYLYSDRVESVSAHAVSESLQQVSEVPDTFCGLPAEFRAAGNEIVTVLTKATSSIAAGIHELQASW